MATRAVSLSVKELSGLRLTPRRLKEVLEAYRGILAEISKLRELDLTSIHPPIVFDPEAVYRSRDEP